MNIKEDVLEIKTSRRNDGTIEALWIQTNHHFHINSTSFISKHHSLKILLCNYIMRFDFNPNVSSEHEQRGPRVGNAARATIVRVYTVCPLPYSLWLKEASSPQSLISLQTKCIHILA